MLPCDMASDPRLVTLRYAIPRARDEWTLSEETVPEARPHHCRSAELEQLLAHWAARSGKPMQVGGNLAVRWDEEHRNIGVDPDVYVVTPPPPEGDEVTSLRLWEPGHVAPCLAVEIVSPNHATKDYAVAPEKYAASGTGELWIFDPELAGPRALGGPVRIQIWCRDARGDFTRIYAGPGPVRSPALDAWLFSVDEGRRLRIADDEHGTSWWMTAEEAEREAKEAALTTADAERVAKETALARVAELEAELARRTRG
jgi:Uma2 family endonuclease